MMFRIMVPNLSQKVAGVGITTKEYGFVLNFVLNNYLTFHLRPKRTVNIRSVSSNKINTADYAIIIQGPIREYAAFLLETINLYEKIFPDVLIVISTWINEKESVINKLNRKKVKVLLNDLPIDGGLFNVDFQTTSTYAGIKYAERQGVKYCIKTRADCRIYKENTLSFLTSIMSTFPNTSELNLKSRIIASSLATCKYRVYGLTEIFLFGAVSDLQQYFLPSPHEKWLDEKGIDINSPLIYGTPIVSEIFLCARYLDSLGVELDWTLEHWWSCLKNHFCVFDAESIDLFWYKYDWQFEKRFCRSYANKSPRVVEFSDWLSLFSGQDVNWAEIDYKETWGMENGNLKQLSIF